MLTVYFVRHGVTANNAKGIVQGRLNSILSEKGRAALKKLRRDYHYPPVERVYSSPAIRAQETAGILYPHHTPVPVEGFWEYSFGAWEGRSMADIAQTPVFPKWLAQDPDCKFEGGETLLEASLRARAAMTWVIQDARERGLHAVAVVAHGEIFALLFHHVLVSHLPPEDFTLCPNGMGVVAAVEPEAWFKDQKLHFVSFLPEGAPRPRPEDSPYFQKR